MKENFIVLGAEKSGTTALHVILRNHPELFLLRKEPEFYSFCGLYGRSGKHDITTLVEYKELYNSVDDTIVIGDVSTTYLPSPNAAKNIKKYNPNARLIAVLRNPVDRAYSRYWMSNSGKYKNINSWEPNRFLNYFYNQQTNPEWLNIRYRGFYHEHLKRYYELFNNSQIKVFLYEDFKYDADNFLRQICDFIGVNNSFVFDNIKAGKSGIAKNRTLDKIIHGKKSTAIVFFIKLILKNKIAKNKAIQIVANIDSKNKIKYPELDNKTRQELIKYYKQDILMLQDLIERDLSVWL